MSDAHLLSLKYNCNPYWYLPPLKCSLMYNSKLINWRGSGTEGHGQGELTTAASNSGNVHVEGPYHTYWPRQMKKSPPLAITKCKSPANYVRSPPDIRLNLTGSSRPPTTQQQNLWQFIMHQEWVCTLAFLPNIILTLANAVVGKYNCSPYRYFP
jgi:hypothetical protein